MTFWLLPVFCACASLCLPTCTLSCLQPSGSIVFFCLFLWNRRSPASGSLGPVAGNLCLSVAEEGTWFIRGAVATGGGTGQHTASRWTTYVGITRLWLLTFFFLLAYEAEKIIYITAFAKAFKAWEFNSDLSSPVKWILSRNTKGRVKWRVAAK